MMGPGGQGGGVLTWCRDGRGKRLVVVEEGDEVRISGLTGRKTGLLFGGRSTLIVFR